MRGTREILISALFSPADKVENEKSNKASNGETYQTVSLSINVMLRHISVTCLGESSKSASYRLLLKWLLNQPRALCICLQFCSALFAYKALLSLILYLLMMFNQMTIAAAQVQHTPTTLSPII